MGEVKVVTFEFMNATVSHFVSIKVECLNIFKYTNTYSASSNFHRGAIFRL